MKFLIYPKSSQSFKEYVNTLLGDCNLLGLTDLPQNNDKGPDEYLCSIAERDSEENGLLDNERRLLKMRIDCGMKTVKEYPLIEGETIEELSHTYFSKPYHDILAGVPVIIRRSDRADVYFVFDEAMWENKQISFTEKAQIVNKNRPVTAAYQILIDLITAALKGFAGKVGAKAFEMIFDSGTCNFDELYTLIKNMVHEELTQAEVDEICGILGGLSTFINNTYIPLKDSKGPILTQEDKKELCDKLFPIAYDATKAMGILKSSRYKKAGLSVYLETVLEIILIHQELALVDPAVQNPKDSSYAISITKYAEQALAHCGPVFNDLAKDRRDKFSYSKYSEGHVVVHEVVVTYYYKWHDSYTGTYSDKFEGNNDKSYDPEKDCKNHMAAAQDSAVATLDSSIKYSETVNALNELMHNPLPK